MLSCLLLTLIDPSRALAAAAKSSSRHIHMTERCNAAPRRNRIPQS
jgi:hypothetical protein